MIEMKCPACGAPVRGLITSRVVMCEYCDTQFVLDADTADAVVGAGEYDEYDEYAEYYGQWGSMAEFAQDMCAEFINEVGDDCFTVSNKIFWGLGIDENEDVYLIHDDSLLGRGKNGFAITEGGLVCREMGEPTAQFLDWTSYMQYDQPYIDDSYIAANGVKLCYYTNNSDLLPYLLSLYETLREACQYLAEWEEEEE